jgi:hypothetical protein
MKTGEGKGKREEDERGVSMKERNTEITGIRKERVKRRRYRIE